MWNNIKRSHVLLMVLFCLIPVVIIAIGALLWPEIFGAWSWLIFLLCPLMHVFMMRHPHEGDKEHKNSCHSEHNPSTRV